MCKEYEIRSSTHCKVKSQQNKDACHAMSSIWVEVKRAGWGRRRGERDRNEQQR